MNALSKKVFIQAQLITESGLHIGGSNISMGIGGADAVVVRNPVTQQPYIPGSSIKGKMRSLIEKLYGKSSKGVSENGPFVDDLEHPICKLFGTANGGDKNIPSRIQCSDCYLTKESAEQLAASEYTDMPYTEVKTEVVIDRVTSSATPRQLERIPAKTTFDFKISVNLFEGDDEQDLLKHVAVALRLLQDDYLGGKGSRGSGQIRFIGESQITYKNKSIYEGDGKAQPLNLGFDIVPVLEA